MVREVERSRFAVRRRATALVAALPLVLGVGVAPHALASTGSGSAAAPATAVTGEVIESYKDGNYIVVLKDAPVTTYDGGVAGIDATKVERGEKLDMTDADVKKYQAHLNKQQRSVARGHDADLQRTYTTVLNGFQADLSAEQATELAKDPQVLAVAENVQLSPDYSGTDFLGLSGRKGTWNSVYGGVRDAGEGVVVGVIDSGYDPDNAFLAGDPVKKATKTKKGKGWGWGRGGKPKVGEPYRDADGTIAMLKSDGTTFRGACEAGEGFAGTECNDKVISARYFAEDFLTYVPEDQRAPEELISPVDVGSHGTHTATTAVGNYGVDQVVAGRDFGTGSGVAPAAKLAVYKICWEDTDPDTGGCYTSASVAAIEQAIVDGVDVLNYSISGNNNSFVDPVAIAFKNAAAAGVFVAASAGNSGPTVSTVAHASPWLTTVAASTFTAGLYGTVEMEDGTKYRGISIAAQDVEQTEVVLAQDAGLPGAVSPNLCLPGTLDPAAATGKIVVCDRGQNARAEKSVVVRDAGGVGMVLVNLTEGSEDSDMHAVPTVHISDPSIKQKVIDNPGITAALRNEDTTDLPQTPFPQIAAFSSRGPSLAADSDLLKPDIAAPGVNVLAGVVPEAYEGNNFGFMSGTSMAAPHVAGMAALMLSKYPKWSPSAVKSAMMTSAFDAVTDAGDTDLDNFATGAGMADPRAMAKPGLVYQNDVRQWDALIAGELAARDVNLASIAVGSLAGEVTVKRTVTAVTPGTYVATADVPGIDVTVKPAKLSFKRAGEKKSFTVTFTNRSAALEAFSHGELRWDLKGKGKGKGTWYGKGRDKHRGAAISVASPVSIRPVAAIAPSLATFTSETGDGAGTIDLVGGVDATVDLSVVGLSKALSTVIEKVPGQPAVIGENESTGYSLVTVPEGATSATFAVNADDPTDDWDMFLYIPATGGVIQAATAAASEQIVLTDPAPGDYYIIGNLYSTSDNGPASASLDFVALQGDAGNLTATPDPLTLRNGVESEITVAWSGLETGTYFGSVVLGDTGKSIALQVTVGGDEPAPAPDATVLTGQEAAEVPKTDLPKKKIR